MSKIMCSLKGKNIFQSFRYGHNSGHTKKDMQYNIIHNIEVVINTMEWDVLCR